MTATTTTTPRQPLLPVAGCSCDLCQQTRDDAEAAALVELILFRLATLPPQTQSRASVTLEPPPVELKHLVGDTHPPEEIY